MRLVQVLVPNGKREAVLRALEDEGIDFAVTPETSRGAFSDVVSFPVPPAAVGPVLDRLRGAGVEDAYTIVLPAETVVSTRLGRLQGRYARRGLNVSREELVARAVDMAPALSTFIILTVVSAAVATTGLLANSAAVIIGAMVIAPLMGPAVAASVGTVVQDKALFRRGVALQAFGVLLAIATAFLLATLLQVLDLVPDGLDVTAIPEVRSRLVPDVLALAIAVGAGVAAIVSLARGAGSVLVGAMIAVALVPPASTVGISAAFGVPWGMLGAGIMVLVNLLSVNLVALSILWWAGYRPEAEHLAGGARRAFRRRAAVLVACLVALAVVLSGVSYVSYLSGTFRESAPDDVRAVLDEPRFTGVELVSVEADPRPTGVLFLGQQPEVTVVVDPKGTTDLQVLADAIEAEVKGPRGGSTAVRVVGVEAAEAA